MGMPGVPSVIDVTDLDGSNGFTIVAANINETPGSSVAIGDVNGDGFADVIVGAPGVAFNYLAGVPDYSAYVIFGHGADDVPGEIEVATRCDRRRYGWARVPSVHTTRRSARRQKDRLPRQREQPSWSADSGYFPSISSFFFSSAFISLTTGP
jgi:uncharacterized short protein YbdD (DUF466 family)